MINKTIKYAMKFHSYCKTRKPVLFLETMMTELINAPNRSLQNSIWKRYCDEVIAGSLALPIAEKFQQDPETFFESMAIILKSGMSKEKGVILIQYNYAFPLFLSLFHVDKVMERYHLVLEPSWTGYCDGSILCFAGTSPPVFVESLEPKDSALLRSVSKNLIPVEIGANWWVDHRTFRPQPENAKDTDICMIASWAKFKRHAEVFDVLTKLRRRGKNLRMILIGYPIDMTKDEIFRMAKERGLGQQIEMYEKIGHEEVARQISRCKVNLVWSKREGVNRAIIEGFMCDVPGILRTGFNYGHKYSYINNETGVFASPVELDDKLIQLIDNASSYNPRKWAVNNMTCQQACHFLSETIAAECVKNGEEFSGKLYPKINGLSGMQYFNSNTRNYFIDDYKYLKSVVYQN